MREKNEAMFGKTAYIFAREDIAHFLFALFIYMQWASNNIAIILTSIYSVQVYKRVRIWSIMNFSRERRYSLIYQYLISI